jgi:hypothetical protein
MEHDMEKKLFARSALPLLFVGCTTSGWNVSSDILLLAQETRVGGLCVIESDAEGRVVNADVQIDTARLPAAVKAAADRELPGPIRDAEREIALDQKYWEVIKQVEGRDIALVFTDDGKLVGKEEELPQASWPKRIVDAANKAVPEGRITMVEFVYGPEAMGGREYHVKKDVGGELVRISVSEDGSIGRVLRKIRAEFKAPR